MLKEFSPEIPGQMFNMAAKVQRSPFGVIGIIGPWNYPFL